MLTKEFCLYLEYYFPAAWEKSPDTDKRRCWCDGVLMPEDEGEYSIEKVLESEQIFTKCWIDEGREKGKSRGQFLYEMSILFGPKALEYYQKGLDLKECLPGVDSDDWIYLDRKTKRIELELL